jgi:hypothetical protein
MKWLKVIPNSEGNGSEEIQFDVPESETSQ